MDNNIPQTSKPEEEVPWWMKYAGRGMGTFGGIGNFNTSNVTMHDLGFMTDFQKLFPSSLQWPWRWVSGHAYRFLQFV